MRFKGWAFGATAAALIVALGSTTTVAQDDIYALSYLCSPRIAEQAPRRVQKQYQLFITVEQLM